MSIDMRSKADYFIDKMFIQRDLTRQACSIALVALFILLHSLSAAAQSEHSGPWSLQDCTNYALEHNITLQQSNLSVQQRETQLAGAKARMLPGVSASAGESFSFGRGLRSDNTYADHSNTTNTSFSVGAQMPIFEGFTIKNNIELSRLNLEAATVDLEKARDDIRTRVAQAYVQILYSKEILGVAKSQIAVDSMQVERLTTMLRTGKASSAEVSAAEATLAQSRLSMAQAEGNLRIAILDLTQLLELPSPEGFDVVIPDVSTLPDETLTPPEIIYEEALQVKPAIRGEQLRLQAAEKNIDIARGGYYPNISLSGGVGTNYYSIMGVQGPSFGTQLRDNFSPALSLSFSVPIFDRFSTHQRPHGEALPPQPAAAAGECQQDALQGDSAGLLQRPHRPQEVRGQPRCRKERLAGFRNHERKVREQQGQHHRVQRSQEPSRQRTVRPGSGTLPIPLSSPLA